ncbi:BQ2448_3785 [Microbotryum intermedium]|uniref:BQ2448_3785 protein n=1 Tax=Microbotryum intermedium TaxID=269621 RepID=A0A238FG92_9BASI|nr:BQ2448_3785 [Microbotryum intermedium]
MFAPDGVDTFSAIANDLNPFTFTIQAAHNAVYPAMGRSCVVQSWCLVGLFVVSMIIVLVGLVLRLLQGRFWLVHRIDSRITMPNISIQNSFWAFMYNAFSIVSLAMTTKIVTGSHYPSWYISFGGFLPLVLFMGQYAEIWATCSSYFVRRSQPHKDDSLLISSCFMLLPLAWPVIAMIPPIIAFSIAAQNLRGLFHSAQKCVINLEAFSAAWRPGLGTDTNLLQLTEALQPLREVAAYAPIYALYTKIAFRYVGGILALTFVLYIVASVVEGDHLRRQSHKLRLQTQFGVAGSPQRLSFPPRLTLDRDAGTASSDPTFQSLQANLSGDDALTSQLKLQASLIEWATLNRLLTAIPVSLMLIINSGLSFSSAANPLHIGDNSGRVQIITLVAAWINVSLSTVVAILILFRSLSGSPEVTLRVKEWAPWLPLAPINTMTKTSWVIHAPLTPTSFYGSMKENQYPTKEGSDKHVTLHELPCAVNGITVNRERLIFVDEGATHASV